ncbi:hypothetical protein WJX77_008812 [Trebouxia sp. C0004]
MRLDMGALLVVSEAVLASDLKGSPAHNVESANARCTTDRTSDAQDCEASGRQTEVNQLDERIATLQLNEQAQYATISSLETSLDNRHAHLSNLEGRIAELEASGDPDLSSLREMSQKQVEIASTLRQLISDNQGQAQARAKIIESQRQQLTARHRRNLLKQAEGDEVAAKLLATRRETMRLRNKIKELKQQHADLRQMKEAQQQQMLGSAETADVQSAQTDSGDRIDAQCWWLDTLGSATDSPKLDQILSMLKAEKEQVYAFSQSKAGRDLPVAAVMNALGLEHPQSCSMAAQTLPTWSTPMARDGSCSHLEFVPENSELSMELTALLAAKKELGEGEGLADHLQLDPDLPPNDRLEAVSNTILDWRETKLSYSG